MPLFCRSKKLYDKSACMVHGYSRADYRYAAFTPVCRPVDDLAVMNGYSKAVDTGGAFERDLVNVGDGAIRSARVTSKR